ncbi:MAG: nucleotide sugar dehydrogenase [Candidatus Bathyarchaeia archaeon]|jgi:UDP-N-acetyl-D-mannosaminuronic acid dehydrogenase
MPAILHLKPEEIDTAEKRQAYMVSVVGCGQTGILYAVAFAEAGYRVICTDLDQSVIKSIAKGNVPYVAREAEIKLKRFAKTGQISATSDLKSAVSQSDIILIAIPVKFDDKKRADYSEIEKICKQVGVALHRDTLVIYAGITGFGVTEGVIKKLLENTSGFKVGDSLGFAYNPIYIPHSQRSVTIRDQELKIAAVDKNSLDSASKVLETVTEKAVHKISDIKTAEAATLFAIAKKDAHMALANELAIFCESAGIDYIETIKAAGLQDTGFSPTIAEENCRDGAYLLLENAENLTVKLRLPGLARQINEQMASHAVNLAQDALHGCGKTLRRARIALLGNFQPQTAAEKLVHMLEKKGAKLNLYDPVPSVYEQASGSRMLKKSLIEAAEGADCIMIISPLDVFKRLNLKKLYAVMKAPPALVDLAGVIETQKVEKEGFIYRGLGRGVRNR